MRRNCPSNREKRKEIGPNEHNKGAMDKQVTNEFLIPPPKMENIGGGNRLSIVEALLREATQQKDTTSKRL